MSSLSSRRRGTTSRSRNSVSLTVNFWDDELKEIEYSQGGVHVGDYMPLIQKESEPNGEHKHKGPSVAVSMPEDSTSDILLRRDVAAKEVAFSLKGIYESLSNTVGAAHSNKVKAEQARQQKVMEERMTAAYSHSIDWCLHSLNTTADGISPAERTVRLARFGPNKISFVSAPTWYKQLGQAIWHPFNALLAMLAILCAATGDLADFAIMFVMIGLSVGVRFYQERNAVIAAESLKKRITSKVVVRVPKQEKGDGGGVTVALTSAHSSSTDIGATSSDVGYDLAEVDFELVVPGDIIHLSAGSLIPCDGRILTVNHLQCNQTILTGESLPVEKAIHWRTEEEEQLHGKDAPPVGGFLRRANLCFNGSIVSSGAGVLISVSTGNETYFGFNAAQLVLPRPPSSFQIGVKNVSYMLLVFMCVMVPAVTIVSGLQAGDWVNAALFALAAAVGLCPEMLPMVVNSNLSVASYRMAQKKCIVKRLESIQNIGSLDIFCSDKTGTLTNDHVQLYAALGYSTPGTNEDDAKLGSTWTRNVGYVIAKSQEGFRNVLDKAILDVGTHGEFAAQAEAFSAEFKGVNEIPFDFNRKRMSVLAHHLKSGRYYLFCKGAMDQTCRACSHVRTFNDNSDVSDPSAISSRPLTEEDRNHLNVLGRQFAEKGLRVLAVAGKEFTTDPSKTGVSDEKNLILYGFLAFLDTPKADAAQAIVDLRAANVSVKVLTGDNPLIARQVCRELGMPLKDDEVLTSDGLHALEYLDEDKELLEIFERVVLFAGLSPDDKARVVRVLRLGGHEVGFLGDGLNDAAALKEADVGVSVDTGSDLAKDAADMILTEKSLAVLKDAVITGRTTHGNTIKYIKMAASGNFGNVFSLIIAAGMLPFTPMQPQQILLQNLLYDFSQTMIPFDKMDAEYLVHPKKWEARDIARFMCVGPVSSCFDVTTFCIGYFYYGWQNANTSSPDQYELQTIWFIEGLISQCLIVHMLRTEKIPFFQSMADPRLSLALIVVCAAGIIIPYLPGFGDTLFQFVTPPGDYYGFLVAEILAYFMLAYFVKIMYIRKFHKWL